MPEEEIDHEYTDEIVCPYCGYMHDCSWEFDERGGDISCEECHNEFEYEVDYSISYTTRKKEVPNAQ